MNGNPRVGYVVKRYPRYSETFIVNELIAHEAAGLEVEIFALRPPVDSHFQDLISRVRAPVHYLPHAGLKARELWEGLATARKELPDFEQGMKTAWRADVVDVFQAAALAREVRARGIEHLHAHFASSPTSVAEIAAKMAGIPFSFTAHAKDIYHEDIEPEQLRRKQRNAAAVITVSDFNVRHLRESDPVSADRVVRIYNGLDLETFRFQAPRARPKRIVAVGRLVEKKGFGVLLDACAAMAATAQDFECRIIGAGPLEADLRRHIDELALGAKVALEGPLPQARIREEVQAAAVFAAPCVVGEDGNRDGLPTTLLEAMALGTPCISTNVTGIPEIVRHDETGLLVPQREPAALAHAATRLLADPETRVRLAIGARRLIESHFDVADNTARQRGIFRSAAYGAADLQDVAQAVG